VTTRSIQIGKRTVTTSSRPLFFPDIGTFFDKDISQAKEMVAKLHEDGAEILKGEILHSASIALDIDYDRTYFIEKKRQSE